MSSAAPTASRPIEDHGEIELLQRYRREGNMAARERLTRCLMPLARDIARRYRYTGQPLDELTAVAYMGLAKAIERFECDRGSRLPSYAVPTIRGELQRHLRNRGWAVHVPRALQERVLMMNRESEALTQRLGHSPSIRDVATALDWTVEEALEVHEAACSYEATSLDAPLGGPDTGLSARIEVLGCEDGRYERLEARDAIASAWHRLSETERRVIVLRFRADLSQREIAERIGVSQMQVSRLLRHALDLLREGSR